MAAEIDVECISSKHPLPAGHEKPFRLWSTLAIQTSISSTPLVIGTYLSVVIGVGGNPIFFFGYLLCSCMSLLICASLSEIAAVLPHPLGQIYWTAALAPARYSRGLSYIVGWFTCAAWFFSAAATYLFAAQLTMALVLVCQENLVALPWHTYLVYIGTASFALLLNLPLFKIYPYLLNGLVPFIDIGALFIMIGLLVRVHDKQPASFVFTDFVNATGWTSDGMVFFLGLLPGAVSVIGFDAAAHMTMELPNPKIQVPKIIMIGTAINIVAGFPMILVYLFCIVNKDNLLAPIGGQPVVQIFVDSFDSLTLTIIASIVLIVCFVGGGTTIMTVFSRTWWAFAAEYGIPFSGVFSKTNEKLHLPVNSILFCFFSTLALGSIQLGSTTALNAFGGALVTSFYASYMVPIILLLIQRRRSFPEQRYFNLGRAGPIINVIAILWMAMMFVWLCFPSYVPVELVTMNWSSVVFVGILFISVVNWFLYSKDRFTAPVSVIEGI
ncbi:hypothetical protein VE00_04307 [Pseudogymnoascus sp. WSF 3629]|nr:hypothetical protein VE00_04307 [Pseudogymnoascus sp. WSF 3629]